MPESSQGSRVIDETVRPPVPGFASTVEPCEAVATGPETTATSGVAPSKPPAAAYASATAATTIAADRARARRITCAR